MHRNNTARISNRTRKMCTFTLNSRYVAEQRASLFSIQNVLTHLQRSLECIRRQLPSTLSAQTFLSNRFHKCRCGIENPSVCSMHWCADWMRILFKKRLWPRLNSTYSSHFLHCEIAFQKRIKSSRMSVEARGTGGGRQKKSENHIHDDSTQWKQVAEQRTRLGVRSRNGF